MVELFSRAQWMSFCDKLQGYDDEVAEEFLRTPQPKSKTLAVVNFRGLTIKLTPQSISRVTELPMGVPWDKEERKLGQKAKKEFFLPEEQFSEDKNGVRRVSLQPFWSEVSLQIMKYITCEGRFRIVYGCHFRLLVELRHQMDLPSEKRLSIPYFLLQSMTECATKLREGMPDQIAHHGLIKLLVEDALHNYTVPLSWEVFRNMTKNDDIQVLIAELTSSSSEGKGPIHAEKKGKGQETTAKAPKEEHKQKQEKNQAAKTEGDQPTLTPREKRLRSRVERTEKVHVSKGTPKVTSLQSKGEAPSAKQAKTVPPVSTGKSKTASKGSQKSAATGLSTGSPEKGKKVEKTTEILAREAAAVLATLSTPPKPKEK